jgi:outer membrane protein insertion porin family
MKLIALNKYTPINFLTLIIAFGLLLNACTIPRKYQKGKPFVAKNNIEVKEGNFTKDERSALKQRLNAQLDDSSRVKVKDVLFFLHFIDKPPAYDSASAAASAKNMKSSMIHLGYYGASTSFKADTIKKSDHQQVSVQYTVKAGKPTLIDTVGYFLRKPNLQELTIKNIDKSLLEKHKPVTKAAVLGEVGRLVELYRNNGYYKITADELKVRGDTTIEALTTIAESFEEQLELIAKAQAQRDSPKIKMAIVLNNAGDSTKTKPYYINNIYIMPDFRAGDSLSNPAFNKTVYQNCIILYHQKLFKPSILTQSLLLKKGDLYNQELFYKSLNNYSKVGVWQNTNIQIVESKDSSNKIDLVVQLIPNLRYSFEASLEASYSANSNSNNVTTVNAGNLLGISSNLKLTDRNAFKEAVKLTYNIRAGIELNLNNKNNTQGGAINSNELSGGINAAIPKFISPFKFIDNKNKKFNKESIINLNGSLVKRINLFNLQTANLGFGLAWTNKKLARFTIKPINIEFARLYNETPEFINTLNQNPFLRYSFNTSLVGGLGFNYSITKTNSRNSNKQHSLRINVEESGNIYRFLPKRYLRNFIKADIEYIYSLSLPKKAFVVRGFLGAGFALRGDTTLPFFKQYFGGGANSMRGWPVRGIGRGSQPLTPYNQNNVFNDRTGDLQLEINGEYRFDIAQIIPNSLILKGVLFADAGNIWNLKNSKPSGGTDSAQFKFGNLYKELGLAAGTGLRLDFNYVVLRFDIGFRFKRPEISYNNNGWKSPPIGFDDAFGKLFKKEFKQWRYENMNFTIGISYPF